MLEDVTESTHSKQIVIVTGASSGIGRSIAVHFGERGATVVCASRSNEPHQGERYDTDAATPTEQRINERTPGAGRFIPTDITDSNAVADLIEETVD